MCDDFLQPFTNKKRRVSMRLLQGRSDWQRSGENLALLPLPGREPMTDISHSGEWYSLYRKQVEGSPLILCTLTSFSFSLSLCHCLVSLCWNSIRKEFCFSLSHWRGNCKMTNTSLLKMSIELVIPRSTGSDKLFPEFFPFINYCC